eukprot:g5038.t1
MDLVARVRSLSGARKSRNSDSPASSEGQISSNGRTADSQRAVSNRSGNSQGATQQTNQRGANNNVILKEKPQIPQLNEDTKRTVFNEKLPTFRDVPSPSKQNLFVRKLHLCAFLCDFSDPSKDVAEKDIKRNTLLELVEYVNGGPGRFTEIVSEDVMFMLNNNLFRTLPPSRTHTEGDMFDPEEEEPTLEPSWPHLQLIYEFLLRFVVSTDTDARQAKKYIDHTFIVKLLELFDSEDPRERDYLKTILHRIYGKFMVHRSFIRKAINNVFYRFIFETERHSGIAELLEILGSIINGFALPLKEEHKTFLQKALMPLHKPKCLPMYHSHLSYCVTQFVEKDYTLADPVLRSLLKYWPVVNSPKEVLFLEELEDILELTQAAEFKNVMIPLFRKLAKCINSSHFQVAERSLLLFMNNDCIMGLLSQFRLDLVPVLVPALEENADRHWNPSVHTLTISVRKLVQELDEELYERYYNLYLQEEDRLRNVDNERSKTWESLEVEAAMNSL